MEYFQYRHLPNTYFIISILPNVIFYIALEEIIYLHRKITSFFSLGSVFQAKIFI